LGGIEGLSQKYEGIAASVSDSTGYTNYLMVNGDDLRIILLVPRDVVPPGELHTCIADLQKAFEKIYNNYGFTLKIEESHASECLLGFGKVYICERAWQTCTLKKG
jgi:hypothetical protein